MAFEEAKEQFGKMLRWTEQPKDQAQMIIHFAKLVIPRQTEEITLSNHIDLSDMSTDEIKALLRE